MGRPALGKGNGSKNKATRPDKKCMSGVTAKEQKPGGDADNKDREVAKSILPDGSRPQKKNVGLPPVLEDAKDSPDHEDEAQGGGEKGGSDASAGSAHAPKGQGSDPSKGDKDSQKGGPGEGGQQRPSKAKENASPDVTNDGEAGEGPDAIESTVENGQEGAVPADKVSGLVRKADDGQGSIKGKERAQGPSNELWVRLSNVILSPLRMISRSFKNLLSLGADKQLRELEGIAEEVNALSERFEAMSDEELRGMTAHFRERYEGGETLDELLPEAFAAVREASSRVLGMRHFDEQIMGGVALHRGMIAEMKTGEGKTLVAPLAAYLNAIPGRGVHVVTVNDYLARRDSEWMGGIYERLGMSVGCLQNGMRLDLKGPAYAADITYGTNSEFGFDYLRDNMVARAGLRVQRGHAFAIVDEVDSILIDEARTPLIISGVGTKSASTYKDFARAVRGLTLDVDFEMDEAKHTIAATEVGLRKIEGKLGIDDLYSDLSGQMVNHLQQALRAQYLFHRDQQYMVVGGEVKIVDEFTGRAMEGRRYSEGLHQAIEAKEGVFVKEENQTLATITLQNYFRLYDKLSGMTGTAVTEDSEFREIYNLPVQAIPTHEPMIRADNPDLVYQSVDAKFAAVAEDIAERHAKGQPVLVGTVSIESSERLSRILDKRGVPHEVLNAKHHEREAQIVAQAGRKGAVTIATNMAGRGTDIILGGNPDGIAHDMLRDRGYFSPAEKEEEIREPSEEEWEEARKAARKICEAERAHVLKAGGLCVMGTERHESRRIDNQLRGRSGRQGDPGETQFYLSLGDDLMRLFGGERMDRIADMMGRYDMPADMPIQSRLVSRAIEGAQRKVEEINFAMRKQVLEYDDVMNEQRRVIYEERDKILDGKDLLGHVHDVTHNTVRRKVEELCPEGQDPEDWDLMGLREWVEGLTGRKDMPEFGSDWGRVDEGQSHDEGVSSEVVSVSEGRKLGPSEEREDDSDGETPPSISASDEDDAGSQASRTAKGDGASDFPGDKDDEASISVKPPVAAKDSAKAMGTAGESGGIPHHSQSVEVVSNDDVGRNPIDIDDLDQSDVIDHVNRFVSSCYSEKSDQLSDGEMQALSAQVMLRVIDTRWMTYLQEMDYLKAGIGLRGFGQRDPLVEYKSEAYAAFAELVNTMYEDFLRTILRIELVPVVQARALGSEGDDALRGAKYSGPSEVDGDQGAGKVSARLTARRTGTTQMQATGPAPSAPGKPATYRKADDPDPYANVERNDPCPCGSGKKFKNCHGRNRGGGTR